LIEKAKKESLLLIKEKIHLYRNNLLYEFEKIDKTKTKLIKISTWGQIITELFQLKLDWDYLCPYLNKKIYDGELINYMDFLFKNKTDLKIIFNR
jgi:hypothetical protein